MKCTFFVLAIAFCCLGISAFTQVEIDQSIQLTGTGLNARISGIEGIADTSDAVNVKTVARGTLNLIENTTYSVQGSVVAGAVGNVSMLAAAGVGGIIAAGILFRLRVPGDNTGPVSISINGMDELAIVKNVNNPLLAGDLKEGQMIEIMFDGTNFQLLSPVAATVGPKPCPPGFIAVNDSYCIQAGEGVSGEDFYAAIVNCGNLGGRLCTMAEHYFACQLNPSGVTGMSNANWEWVSDIAGSYQHSGVDYVQVGNSSCSSSQVVDYSTSNGGARVRCCFTR